MERKEKDVVLHLQKGKLKNFNYQVETSVRVMLFSNQYR